MRPNHSSSTIKYFSRFLATCRQACLKFRFYNGNCFFFQSCKSSLESEIPKSVTLNQYRFSIFISVNNWVPYQIPSMSWLKINQIPTVTKSGSLRLNGTSNMLIALVLFLLPYNRKKQHGADLPFNSQELPFHNLREKNRTSL